MRLSVILCSHNPREAYLARCLEALCLQTLPNDQWELILVDNASERRIESLGFWVHHSRWRIVHEPTLGLTPARLRGIRESSGKVLVFVDDDNVVDADFLEAALRIADEKPFLGSWSGQCRPEFEERPPGWTRRYWGNLVIRECDSDVWSNLPRLAASMPCGAGLCVRRNVAERYLFLHVSGQRPFQLDRVGDSLISGGDNDLAACACDIGLGLGLVTSLKLKHLIPPERLTEDYISRLVEGVVVSAVVLAHLRACSKELASYRVRWHEPLRAMLAGSPHRRIQAASIRGRRRGLRFVEALRQTVASTPQRIEIA